MLTVHGQGGGSSESQICPSLSKMQISRRYVNDLTEDMVEEMIVSRWKAGSLRSTTFAFPRFIGLHRRKRVRECIKEGLAVVNGSFKFD